MTQLAYNLKQPFPLSIQFSSSFPFILGFATYVVLFLFLFQPFGIENHLTLKVQFELFGYGIVVMMVMGLNYYGLTGIFPGLFRENDWSLGHELIWLGWNTVTCCIAVGLYGVMQTTPECQTIFWGRFGEGLLVSLLPLTVYLLWSYNNMFRKKLASANNAAPQTIIPVANANISASQMNEVHIEKSLILSSENESEHLSLPLQALRYIESRDNYSLVVWWDGRKLRKQMLRSSLKRLAGQIECPAIKRCHRSFIVNLSQVDDIRGNSRGYRLYLHNCAEEIPVSRENGRSIKQFLKNIIAA